jgi:hypothetical protein
MNDLFVYLSTALQDVNMTDVLTTAGAFLAISLVISWLGKTFFGPDSGLSNAVSSAIGILFIYVATIAVISIGGELEPFKAYLSPLPFVRIEHDTLMLFVFENADHATICSQLLSMVILAFLVNLLDSMIPRGESIIGWYLLRILTVILSMVLHLVATSLLQRYLPDFIVTYAPEVLLILLALMLFSGFISLILGMVISVTNPFLGAMYSFFFSNVVGKQLSKAVFSSAILCGIFFMLEYCGYTIISISAAALIAYIPIAIILLILWYLIGHLL